MRLAARSVRETREGRIVAALLLAVLIAVLVGPARSGLAADITGTITPGGGPVTVTISTAGDNAALTFAGSQNQRVAVSLTAVSIGTSGCCSAKASIRKPDGTNLVAPQFFGTVGGFLDAVSLPSSGTYTIYIDPQSTSTGSVTVTAYDVPADVSGPMAINGGKTGVSLLTPGQNARLTFEGVAGQSVRLTMSEVSIAGSGCCSARASIEGPGGSTLGTSQFFGTVGGSLVRTLIGSGTHSVFIDPVDAFTGAVKLELTIAGRSPSNGSTVRTTYPVLRVDPAANPNTDYFYEIATDSGFTNIVDASGAMPTTTTFRPSVRLGNDTTYYWRWKTTGTAWSTANSFTTKEKLFGTREEWPMWSKGPLAVNKATGNLVLSLPGPSYPTAVGSMGASVTYNSLDTKDHVGLGPGWTLNAGPDLSAAPKSLVDLSLLGEEEKMEAAEVQFADGDSAFYGRVGQTNTYIAEPGDGSLLSKNANGTWTLAEGDGVIYTFKLADTMGVAKLDSVEFVDAGPGKGKLTYAFEGTKVRSITDGAGRQLVFKWTAAECPNAILCIEGPDSVTWRYIGAASGGTAGWLTKVNNGTRDVAAVEYDVVGQVYKVRNANDLDPSSASPGYNPDHVITIAYCCGTSNRKVMWISDGYITLADGGSQSATTWFEYYIGGAGMSATRATHGLLAAGTVRAAAGYTTVQPPRQQGAQNPKLITSHYDGAGREIQTIDILGKITMAGYDAHGNQSGRGEQPNRLQLGHRQRCPSVHDWARPRWSGPAWAAGDDQPVRRATDRHRLDTGHCAPRAAGFPVREHQPGRPRQGPAHGPGRRLRLGKRRPDRDYGD